MRTQTYQERIEKIAENAETMVQLLNDVQPIVDEIMNEDSRLWSTSKRMTGYGTWRVTLFVNKYQFGNDLANELNNIAVITHDEDKEYALADLEEEIRDCVESFAYSKF